MSDTRQAPGSDADCVSPAQPDAINEPAGRHDRADGRKLEAGHDVGVVQVSPAKLVLKHRLEQGDRLTVDVVDHRCAEDEGKRRPAQTVGRGVCPWVLLRHVRRFRSSYPIGQV